MSVYRSKCQRDLKNRLSHKGDSLYTEGSISIHEHAIRMV